MIRSGRCGRDFAQTFTPMWLAGKLNNVAVAWFVENLTFDESRCGCKVGECL